MPKKHLYLPKITPGANIDEPVSNALWEDKQKKIILAISDGIELDETAQTRGVSSIPDIYARPLTFLGALRSEHHPLRNRVLQEWKGLLSLLALHKVKPDLDGLTITPVVLGEEKFSRALKNLAPAPIRLQKNGVEYSWTDILLIRFGEIPLGAFSPATLVYTSADYNTQLNEKSFSLKDEKGYLKPPGKHEGLNYVGEWLENFIKQFNVHALNREGEAADSAKNYQYAGDINKLLDAWLSEIRAELGYEPGTRIEVPGVKPAEEFTPLSTPTAFISKYSIYKALLTPLIKDETASGNGNKSEYALYMSRNRSPYKEVVVIHQQQLVENKILWDGQRPSELGAVTELISKFFTQSSGTVINRTNLEPDKAIWIRPEMYFLTNTLVKGKDSDILNESERFLNAGNTNYLLPFKKEILQFFSPVQIQEILKPKFKKSGENGVEFSFSLPLSMNQQIEIKKIYLSKGADSLQGQGSIRETEVPVLEIFPNYLGDFWCQYFMLCSDTDKFVITPYNYEHDISITRREQKFESNDSSSIRAEIVRISGYNAFPEGVEVKPLSAFEEAYGLILINKNKDVEGKPFNGKALIGIDFGTSNTNIFKKVNDNAARWNFSFSKYVRSLLNTSDGSDTDNKRRRLTRMFFVPVEDQQLPIPTALRIFKAGVTANMLLDHFIFFPDASRYPDNVYTDIKWDDDNSKLHSFLQSLIFLLIIDLMQERVGKISFRCSYPKSFTNDKVAAYKRYWTQILGEFFHVEKNDGKSDISASQFIYTTERMFEQDGDEYIIATKNNGKFSININPEFATEGIAAGEYFSSEYIIKDGVSFANKEDGSVCIDVGGGTSDYSIWFNSHIRIDASVLLAGKQISRLLKNNSRVRDILLSEDSSASLNEVKNDDSLFFSRLNYVLRKEEKFIASRLSNNANNKDIAWLRRILAIEFGALSFYAAHLCLALDDFVNGDLAERIKMNGIKLHWGGNAAKFINWIDYGKYEKDGIASKLLNGMFINTILDKSLAGKAFKPAMLAQVQSPGHKDEASGGIVVMDIEGYKSVTEMSTLDEMIIDDEAEPNDMLGGLVIGEKISVNNKTYEHYQTINKETLFNNSTSLFGGTDLVQLERFLYLINQVGKITGLFPEGSQITLSLEEKLAIKQRVKNDIAALARLKPDARIIEPVFIMEVKFLLDILSNKMR